jgi:hypothetical protein
MNEREHEEFVLGDLAALALREAFDVVEDNLRGATCMDEAKEEREHFIALLPDCFVKSYDMAFFASLLERVESMADQFDEDWSIAFECVADEIAFHLVTHFLPNLDMWRVLNRHGRDLIQTEIEIFEDGLGGTSKFAYLYDNKETQTKAIADPAFIAEHNLRNLHIDRWFHLLDERTT